MIYTGLDLSLIKTGIATIHDDMPEYRLHVEKAKGSCRLYNIQADIQDCINPRYLSIVNEKEGIIAAVEGYAFAKNVRGQYSKAELHGAVILILRSLTIPTIIVPPTSLKKFITGNGRAQKWEMIKAINEIYSLQLLDDNLADAIGLARVAECWYTRDSNKFSQEQLDIVRNIDRY